MDYAAESLKKHEQWKGKIEVVCRAPLNTREDLSLAYTPGVAQPCLEIQKDVNKSYDLTRRSNLVAVVTDGTAVLGLGAVSYTHLRTAAVCVAGLYVLYRDASPAAESSSCRQLCRGPGCRLPQDRPPDSAALTKWLRPLMLMTINKLLMAMMKVVIRRKSVILFLNSHLV